MSYTEIITKTRWGGIWKIGGYCAAIACLIATPLFYTVNASAESVYDYTLKITSALKYRDASGSVVDISNIWRTHLSNACGATIYNDFVQSLDGGAYAVVQDPTNDTYGVTVVWSKADNTIPSSSFYTSANPSMRYFAVDPGWQGKARFHFNTANNTETCDYSTVAVNNPYGSTLSMEQFNDPSGLYESSYNVNYPDGYIGDSAPTPVLIVPIQGNVQCANNQNVISAVHINVNSGIEGNAQITNDGMGGVNYRYYLSEDSPYHLTVLCDGDMFTGPTVESNYYSIYNWVCTNTIPGQDGNLHVCAAS